MGRRLALFCGLFLVFPPPRPAARRIARACIVARALCSFSLPFLLAFRLFTFFFNPAGSPYHTIWLQRWAVLSALWLVKRADVVWSAYHPFTPTSGERVRGCRAVKSHTRCTAALKKRKKKANEQGRAIVSILLSFKRLDPGIVGGEPFLSFRPIVPVLFSWLLHSCERSSTNERTTGAKQKGAGYRTKRGSKRLNRDMPTKLPIGSKRHHKVSDSAASNAARLVFSEKGKGRKKDLERAGARTKMTNPKMDTKKGIRVRYACIVQACQTAGIRRMLQQRVACDERGGVVLVLLRTKRSTSCQYSSLRCRP